MCGAEGVFSFAGAQAVHKELARVKAEWGLRSECPTVDSTQLAEGRL